MPRGKRRFLVDEKGRKTAVVIPSRPKQCRKLAGRGDSYRLRVEVYRVIYEVDEKAAVVTVSAVAHRREAYRRARRGG